MELSNEKNCGLQKIVGRRRKKPEDEGGEVKCLLKLKSTNKTVWEKWQLVVFDF